jgi:hypothetical protein
MNDPYWISLIVNKDNKIIFLKNNLIVNGEFGQTIIPLPGSENIDNLIQTLGISNSQQGGKFVSPE